MEFALSEEHQMLKDLVARFVRDQLMPLEPAVLEREACGKGIALTEKEKAPLDKLSRELGLWGWMPRRSSVAQTCPQWP